MGRIAIALMTLGILAACQQAPSRPPAAGLGEACGGLAGIACAGSGTYCKTEPEAMCGAADQTGICTAIPQICTREYRPVCGCDGETYGNACEASAAGVSVAAEGRCADQ